MLFRKKVKYGPPNCKDVKSALKRLGFNCEKQNGTSHEHYRLTINGRLYKVTVDCPKAPFGPTLVLSMASQAGLTKKQFLEFCNDKKLRGHPLLADRESGQAEPSVD